MASPRPVVPVCAPPQVKAPVLTRRVRTTPSSWPLPANTPLRHRSPRPPRGTWSAATARRAGVWQITVVPWPHPECATAPSRHTAPLLLAVPPERRTVCRCGAACQRCDEPDGALPWRHPGPSPRRVACLLRRRSPRPPKGARSAAARPHASAAMSQWDAAGPTRGPPRAPSRHAAPLPLASPPEGSAVRRREAACQRCSEPVGCWSCRAYAVGPKPLGTGGAARRPGSPEGPHSRRQAACLVRPTG